MSASLSPEIIILILNHLRDLSQSQILTCATLSIEWRRRAIPVLYAKPILTHYQEGWVKFSEAVENNDEVGQYVRELDLSSVGVASHVQEPELDRFLKKARHLTTLNLKGCTKVEQLTSLTPHIRQLIHLCLRFTTPGDFGLSTLAVACGPSLHTLDLSYNKNLTSTTALTLLSWTPNLRVLDMSFCSKINLQFFEGFAKARMRALTRAQEVNPDLKQLPLLDLRMRHCTSLVIKKIENISLLRALDLRSVSVEEDALMQLVLHNPLLESFYVGSLRSCNVSSDFVRHLVRTCYHLRRIVLWGASQVKSDCILDIITNLPHLEILHLYKANISEDDVEMLLRGLVRLKELNIAGCPQIRREYNRKIVRDTGGRVDAIFVNFGGA